MLIYYCLLASKEDIKVIAATEKIQRFRFYGNHCLTIHFRTTLPHLCNPAFILRVGDSENSKTDWLFVFGINKLSCLRKEISSCVEIKLNDCINYVFRYVALSEIYPIVIIFSSENLSTVYQDAYLYITTEASENNQNVSVCHSVIVCLYIYFLLNQVNCILATSSCHNHVYQ